MNGVWHIPEGTEKPSDGRVKASLDLTKRRPLPIGVSDFKDLVSNYYYVDKTLMIRDFLDTRAKVTLFARPRRFGKTLNMDMLKTFFEISKEDTAKYFTHLNIWSCGEEYKKEQGQYPAIFVSFKDAKSETWKNTFESIQSVITQEYRRHKYLLASDLFDEYEKKYFENILEGNATEVGWSNSIKNLSGMLRLYYNKPVIIIIDEYDTPIQQGYTKDYYDDVISFMRNLFSGAFKDNSNLAYGFMTGILRVAKESIFSGLNNLKLDSILETRYSKYFGFTTEEIQSMMNYYNRSDKYEEICAWYDGYQFGNTEIFNPWSVINYMDENCVPKAFWQATGDNSIIRQIVAEADEETSENLRKLMQGQTVYSYIDTSVIYPEIKRNPSTIYSFLLVAGYLKVINQQEQLNGNLTCSLAIPNKEIFFVYEKEIISALEKVIPQSTAISIQKAIVTKDETRLKEYLQKLLIQSVSSFDYAHENFYHGLMLGICAIMNNLYHVDSNRESGYGRYDIQLCPIDKTMPGIVIELKVADQNIKDDVIEDTLKQSAKDAVQQINDRAYITQMQRDGIQKFIKIGVVFYKKHVEVVSEEA